MTILYYEAASFFEKMKVDVSKNSQPCCTLIPMEIGTVSIRFIIKALCR